MNIPNSRSISAQSEQDRPSQSHQASPNRYENHNVSKQLNSKFVNYQFRNIMASVQRLNICLLMSIDQVIYHISLGCFMFMSRNTETQITTSLCSMSCAQPRGQSRFQKQNVVHIMHTRKRRHCSPY